MRSLGSAEWANEFFQDAAAAAAAVQQTTNEKTTTEHTHDDNQSQYSKVSFFVTTCISNMSFVNQ